MTLSLIGPLGFSLPPTNLVLVTDIWCVNCWNDCVLEVLELTSTGTRTALFQFSEAFPASFISYINLIISAILLNSKLFVDEALIRKATLLSGVFPFSK